MLLRLLVPRLVAIALLAAAFMVLTVVVSLGWLRDLVECWPAGRVELYTLAGSGQVVLLELSRAEVAELIGRLEEAGVERVEVRSLWGSVVIG